MKYMKKSSNASKKKNPSKNATKPEEKQNIPSIITLLTDFGLKDTYVAQMKGVILSISPETKIVDITHQIPPQNILQAAYLLSTATKHFPKKTIHIVVVDPGVGSERKAIVIQTKRSFLVGPDNGVLILAAEEEGITKIVQITNKKYMLNKISQTFHGRDVFAPAAAFLSKGIQLSDLGPELNRQNIVYLPIEKAKIIGKKIVGQIIHIDRFGNAVTNITKTITEKFGIKYGDDIRIKINKKPKIEKRISFRPTFSHVKKGEIIALINSDDKLELSVNQGSAEKILHLKVKMFLEIELNK